METKIITLADLNERNGDHVISPNTIIVATQQEWDALPDSFPEAATIEIRTACTITIHKVPESSHVVARESSHVVAWGSSHVAARESSHVVAWGSSHVEAWGSSHVAAWESSHVAARGSSHVAAWESSHVVAWGSSHVEAWGSSHVEAWESSHVAAWGSSHVVAWGQTITHHNSDTAPVLHGQAVCFRYPETPAPLASNECTVITVHPPKGLAGWLGANGVMQCDGAIILYKRVSAQYKTQENTRNETTWAIGATLNHPAWCPTSNEYGEGKYHACSRPYFCDEFRHAPDDVYVAIRVQLTDLYAWDGGHYPHKIAFRSGTVLHRVNSWGDREG